MTWRGNMNMLSGCRWVTNTSWCDYRFFPWLLFWCFWQQLFFKKMFMPLSVYSHYFFSQCGVWTCCIYLHISVMQRLECRLLLSLLASGLWSPIGFHQLPHSDFLTVQSISGWLMQTFFLNTSQVFLPVSYIFLKKTLNFKTFKKMNQRCTFLLIYLSLNEQP